MPDYGPRIRAARGWAELSQDALAEALGRNKQWVLRRELSPAHERHQASLKGDLIAISQVCGVPLEFLTEGFGGAATSEISERLAELREEVQDLRRELLVRAREGSQRSDASDQPGGQSQGGRHP